MTGYLSYKIMFSNSKHILRFGFHFDEEGASLEERAERLRRMAQENLEETVLSLEEVESR